MASSANRHPDDLPSNQQPGHLIRRMHQIHDALWTRVVSQETTPTQFSLLSVVARLGECDQTRAARAAALDTSTAGSVVGRLIDRGWIASASSPVDRRRNILRLTPLGQAEHDRLAPAAAELSDEVMRPLDEAEQAQLVALLDRLVSGHER